MDREEAKEILRQEYTLYSSGEYEKAFPLFVQGAEAGFIPAYVMIGDCYWNGDGVEKDTTKAIQYYLASAEMENIDGMMRMGDVYLRCNELQKAIDIYTKAAEKGAADAFFNLGNLYYSGTDSMQRDLNVAAKYFEQYVDTVKDDADAFYLLDRCYVFMKEQNLPKAEKMFEISASLGNQQAVKDLNALQLGGSIIDCY